VESELGETVVVLIEHSSDVEDLGGVDRRVRLDVTSHTVDDVGHGNTWIGLVGVVVDDGSSIDGTIANRPDTLVPVDVAGEVSVNTVLD